MEFEQNAVVLVTGGAGFIGSNIIEHLLKNNIKVKCLDNLSNGKIQNIEPFFNNNNFEFIEGDIREFKTCINACSGVNYVCHQAALGSVPKSIDEPLVYNENNVVGTLNMLEAAKECKVKKFVYASSSAIYGDSDYLPKEEGKEGNVLSPYALTKKINEYYAKLYNDLYSLSTIGLRYFNVYGKRQDPLGDYAAVIPKFVKATINNKTIVINGDGNQSRDFVHINDVVQANIKSMFSSSTLSGIYNIASEETVNLNQLYDVIRDITKIKTTVKYGPERKGDIKHSQADISNARRDLEFDPKIMFHEGMKLTIDWYKSINKTK